MKNNASNYFKYMIPIKPYLILAAVFFVSISCENSTALFQENKNDWAIKGDADWSFSDNELIGSLESGMGFIMTQKTYKNFILELEFKPDSTVNSGVFIRCNNAEISALNCYELNIWDLHPNQDYRTGALVMKSKPLAHVETLDKWNTYKIKMENHHLQAWVNGVLITDIKDNSLEKGHIALQAAEKGEIKFRNIKLSALK